MCCPSVGGGLWHHPADRRGSEGQPGIALPSGVGMEELLKEVPVHELLVLDDGGRQHDFGRRHAVGEQRGNGVDHRSRGEPRRQSCIELIVCPAPTNRRGQPVLAGPRRRTECAHQPTPLGIRLDSQCDPRVVSGAAVHVLGRANPAVSIALQHHAVHLMFDDLLGREIERNLHHGNLHQLPLPRPVPMRERGRETPRRRGHRRSDHMHLWAPWVRLRGNRSARPSLTAVPSSGRTRHGRARDRRARTPASAP